MKARTLLVLLQSMISGYDQVLEGAPIVNEIMASTGRSAIYAPARIAAVRAEQERLQAKVDRLKALLDQEITIPTL